MEGGHIISPSPLALGAVALNPGLSEQRSAHEISRSPELRRAAADRVEACERALAVSPPFLPVPEVSPPHFPLIMFMTPNRGAPAQRGAPASPVPLFGWAAATGPARAAAMGEASLGIGNPCITRRNFNLSR
jgi:hypothetical protein